MNKSQSRRDLRLLSKLVQDYLESPESITPEDAVDLSRIRSQIDQILPTQPVTTAPSLSREYQSDLSSLEAITDGLMTLARDWTITYVNPTAAQSGLKTPQELIGKNLWEEYPGLRGTAVETHYRQAMAEKIPVQFDMKGIFHDIWYLINVYPSQEGLIVFWVDNTLRKHTEFEIQHLLKTNRRQNALLEAVFETDPNGVAVVTGPDLHFAYVNPVYRYITPDPRVNPVGRPYTDVWPIPSKYSNRDRYRKVIETGQPFQVSGLEFQFPDGSERFFSLQARRMEWDGHPACLIIVWDISDQVRFERALEAANIEIVNEKNRLEAVLESLPVGLAIIDQNGGIDRANPAFHRIWGDPIPETKSVADYGQYKAWWADDGEPLGPEDWAAARSVRENATTIGQYLRIQRFDGRSSYVLNSAAPIYDAYGRINGSAVTMQDVNEHRQMEKALESSESRLKLFVEFAPAAIAMLDRDMRYIVASRRYMIDYRLGDQDITGRSHYDVFPEISEEWRTIHKRCLAGAVEKCAEDPFVRADGSVDWVRWEIHPWYEETGEIGGIMLFSEVITERKNAQEAIKNSRRKLEKILESIQDGFIELDRNWCFTYINQRAARNLGYQPHELIGKNIWATFPAILGTEQEARYRQAMDQEQPQQMEVFDAITKSWYEIHLYPSIEGITLLEVDITDRKRSAEALRESEVRAQAQLTETNAVIEAMSDALIAYNTQGKVVRANWAAGELFGLDSTDVDERLTLVMDSLRGLDGRPIPEVSRPASRALRGEKIFGEIYRLTNAVGREHVVLISANPIYDPDGAIRGAIVLVHYITNHLEVEKQVRKAATQLEVQHRLIDQREQERLQIARDLHDGPVQGLSAAVQMLKMVRMDASESAFAPQLLEIQTLLQQQADDLRTFTGELRPPALSNFGLATAIRNHVSSLQEKYPDIEIQYEEHQVGPALELDKRVALYRIFQESLTNVLKHARATRVRIRLQKSPDQIALEIQDNGVGFEIPRDWLEMARAGHLGLVGMRERAEAIGGSFSIHSGLKSGTTIQVVVPIRLQEAGDR